MPRVLSSFLKLRVLPDRVPARHHLIAVSKPHQATIHHLRPHQHFAGLSLAPLAMPEIDVRKRLHDCDGKEHFKLTDRARTASPVRDILPPSSAPRGQARCAILGPSYP